MNRQQLYDTVKALMVEGKGILAADESDATAGKRLALAKLPNEPEHRRAFREIMFTTPDLENAISGVILYDSTIRDVTSDGLPFPDLLAARGIIPGIKVDTGTVPFAEGGAVVSEGLDGLGARFAEYYELGARFAKWRAVFAVSPVPSMEAIEINCIILARYAMLAQQAGIVPMVEPEVLFQGGHSLAEASLVTTRVLQVLTSTLERYGVDLAGTILKTSMVLAGDTYAQQSTPQEVADATLRTLHLAVPHTMGGIVFLSGGQAPKRATENLHAIARMGKQPWIISSSFSRALEEPMLIEWRGKEENIAVAQKALLFRARMNGMAQRGVYDASKDVAL